jgi:hypothetical protein
VNPILTSSSPRSLPSSSPPRPTSRYHLDAA